MEDRKVVIKNVSNAHIVIAIPTLNVKRELKGNGTSTILSFDVISEGLLSEPGLEVLFKEGFIYIENKQDRIDLGLEEADSAAAPSVISDKEMLKLLERNNPVEIKKVLKDLAVEQQKKFVMLAVNKEIYNAGLAKIIKDVTGYDLLAMIHNKQENEKA